MSMIPEENNPGELNAEEQDSLQVGEELEAQHEQMLAGKYRKQFFVFSSHWRDNLGQLGLKSGGFGSTSIVVMEVVEVESSLVSSPVVLIFAGPVLMVRVVLVLQRCQTSLIIGTKAEGQTDGYQDCGRHQHLE